MANGLLEFTYNLGIAVGMFLKEFGKMPTRILVNPKTLKDHEISELNGFNGILIVEDNKIAPEYIEAR